MSEPSRTSSQNAPGEGADTQRWTGVRFPPSPRTAVTRSFEKARERCPRAFSASAAELTTREVPDAADVAHRPGALDDDRGRPHDPQRVLRDEGEPEGVERVGRRCT